MTNKGVIEIKISSIQEYLKILEDNYNMWALDLEELK